MTKFPDSWKIIKFESTDFGVVYKLLGGWYGGYLNGDSWQLNSGIKEVIETENHYDFIGYSGSIYHCNKTGEHISGIMAAQIGYWEDLSKENPELVTITVVDYKDYK